MNITNLNEMLGRQFRDQWLIPHKLNRDKIYRITVYSKDAISGNYTDGVYFIDLPDVIQEPNKYHLAVESFVVSPNSTTQIPAAFTVEFLDVNQPDTYSTSTRTNSRVACMICSEGNVFWNNTTGSNINRNWVNYQRNISSSTIGIPLMDLSIMRTTQMRIQLKTMADAVMGTGVLGSGAQWAMTLVIYPFSP